MSIVIFFFNEYIEQYPGLCVCITISFQAVFPILVCNRELTIMCDPLSVTGSVIAVVTVAVESCDTLCTFFRSFCDTAEYLKHYISKLEALKAVFADIAELDKATSGHLTLDQGLKSQLEECGLHLQEIEKTVMPSYKKLQMSKGDRLWTKMKWSTAIQRQKIEKLMIRIESHCQTFVLTLLLLNT